MGLIDMPPEIQFEIVENVAVKRALKMLSRTARPLRKVAQEVLFKRLQIDLQKPLQEASIDDLRANAKSIRFLELIEFSSDGEKLSHVTKLLPEMVELKAVLLYRVNLTKEFIHVFLKTAANIPLRVALKSNVYPTHLVTVPSTPLCISHLDFGLVDNDSSLQICRSVVRASALTLQQLSVAFHRVRLMEETPIVLPVLHSLNLHVTDERDAAALITPNKAITKLELNHWPHLPYPFSSAVLPNLRELTAHLKVLNQLVPGRPVEVIEVSDVTDNQDWVGNNLGRSTARVEQLRMRHDTLVPWKAERIGTMLPSLKILSVYVSYDVRGPYVLYLGSFAFRTSLKSSKFSLPSSASRTYDLTCITMEH